MVKCPLRITLLPQVQEATAGSASPLPQILVSRGTKRGTETCSASPETQAWRSCRRHNKTIICLGHLQGFFKRNARAKLSRLAELSCKFSCFSASQAALVLLSCAAGHPRNAASQEWRTETEMFLKALSLPALLYSHSYVLCRQEQVSTA